MKTTLIAHNPQPQPRKDPPLPPLPLPREHISTPEHSDEKILAEEQPGPSRQPLAELHNSEVLPATFFQNTTTASQISLQAEDFTARPTESSMPTLKAKRSTYEADSPRKRSNKRKSGVQEREREQEIKALSSPIPIPKPRRPHSFSSGLLARDSKKVNDGLNRNLARPTSEISLPIPESIRSSMSGGSDWQHSFRVSSFDALAPRPTIKYSESPRRMGGSYAGSRSSTRKGKGPAIPEEDFNAKARMNDLADDLDAKGLRELMEKDRRRRERKKKTDDEKLQRKLQRRSEKQAAAAEMPAELGQGELRDNGHERDGPSEIQPRDSPGPANRDAAQSPSSWLQDPSREHLHSPSPDPLADPMNESRLDLGTPSERGSEKDVPIIETAKAVRLSSASMSPPSSPVQKHALTPSNLSNLTTAPEDDVLADAPDPDRLQPSTSSRDYDNGGRLGNSWTSLFRRSGTRARRSSAEKERATPSEFSNTSRESFARQKPSPTSAPRSFKRNADSSGIPQRTQSKFREDLPELPISPTSSRVQSPESAVVPSPYIDHASKVSTMNDEARGATPLGDIHPAFRDQLTGSRNLPLRTPSPEGPSSNVLSQSLASVDSEGSWLSGRPPKRSSLTVNPLRGSTGSLSQNLRDEDLSISEEPDFSRREPILGASRGPGGLASQLRSINTAAAANYRDDDYMDASAFVSPIEESVKYDVVRGRKPNIVQRGSAAKSREGLLDDYAAEEVSPISPSSIDDSPADLNSKQLPGLPATSSVHRATSVEYGKRGHARHLSAGSAKLLDIPPRSSTEQKRLSGISLDRSKSPLASSAASTTESASEEKVH